MGVSSILSKPWVNHNMKSMWSNDILTDIYIVWMKGLVQLAHSDILTVSQFKQFALENKHIQGGQSGCEQSKNMNVLPGKKTWGVAGKVRREKDNLRNSGFSNTWRSVHKRISHSRIRICFPVTSTPQFCPWYAEVPHPSCVFSCSVVSDSLWPHGL